MKDSFIMYKTFIDAGRTLSGEDFKEYILKLTDMACNETEVSSDNNFINGLLVIAKPLLIAAEKRRQKQKENGKYGVLGKDYGKLGGRPKKNSTENPQKPPMGDIEKTPKNPLNVNVNVNANANVDSTPLLSGGVESGNKALFNEIMTYCKERGLIELIKSEKGLPKEELIELKNYFNNLKLNEISNVIKWIKKKYNE